MTRPKRKIPSSSVIARHWANWEQAHQRPAPWSTGFWDWFEPACMACGTAVFDIDSDQPSFTTWNKSGLERCHIVPRVQDGLDGPQNLVLMCSPCHAAHPDSGDPERTWSWMRDRTALDVAVQTGYMTFVDGQPTVTEKGRRLVHDQYSQWQSDGHELACPCGVCRDAA